MDTHHETRIKQLLAQLRRLPGIGSRSAQRIGLALLQHQRQTAKELAHALIDAMDHVHHCQSCRNFTEHTLCALCADPKRNDELLCVVESPADILAIEQSGSYRGRYFALLGHLSPLDGIGPHELGIPLLQERLRSQPVKEVILATNSTLEGETTATYLAQWLHRQGIPCSRIAHGIPLGGEIEYLDGGTVAHAFTARTHLQPTAPKDEVL